MIMDSMHFQEMKKNQAASLRERLRDILFHIFPPLSWQWKIMENTELSARLLENFLMHESNEQAISECHSQNPQKMHVDSIAKSCNYVPAETPNGKFFFNFRDIVREHIGKDEQGIEIGPLAFSIVPKRSGYNVFILDCATQEDLRNHYASDSNVKTDDIEFVDAVDDGRDFTELLAIPNHSLQYIVSSHNLEHIPDPISFFLRCEKALAPDGRLFLIIPDKRGTFDYLRPHSTTGQILEAHHFKRKKHSLASLFDSECSTVGNDDSGELLLENDLKSAYSKFQFGLIDDNYVDVHAWIFTVSSFLLLIYELRELGIINLGIEKYYERQNNEFFVIMSPEKHDLPFSRQELLERIVYENINPNRKSCCSQKLNFP